MEQDNSSLNILISSGFLAFSLGYIFTQLQKYRRSKEELRAKRLTLIEKLTTDAVRINNLFESLRTDAELNGYFAFKNINIINPMVGRIQSITTDEMVVLDEGDKLRKEIIAIGDFLSSFLFDVDTLEKIAQSQANRDKDASDKFNADIEKLRNNILPYGLQITPQYVIVNPSGDNSNKHYNAALSTLADIQSVRNNLREESANLYQNIKDRRIFYSIKCLDSQNRLNIFISLLEKAENRYAKRTWFVKILNRIAL
jgi:hypothetical protein